MMPIASPPITPHRAPAPQAASAPLTEWPALIAPLIDKLRRLLGSSEHEFLRIGEQMQGVHQQSLEIARLANQLVETASGQNLQVISARLLQMTSDMESHFAWFQSRSTQSFLTLQQVKELLGRLDAPLGAVAKMTMDLYMLEVAIKIESARLGAMGNEFLTLALDIKTLSRQVNDKLGAVKGHRGVILAMITANLGTIQQLSSLGAEKARLTMSSTLSSLRALDAANERFSRLGLTIAGIVKDVASCIGEVVSSLQFHDINRQQLEHIVEALVRLNAALTAAPRQGLDGAACHILINETGDVCELQEAQLQFASAELHSAVSTIVDRLRDVASRQAAIRQETIAASGVMDEGGKSFVDAISRGMASTSAFLQACAGNHQQVSGAMATMATAIGDSCAEVEEIDGIGLDIVQTALNAQIKAGKAGGQGAVLAALAEEIRMLADSTSINTDAISMTLNDVRTVMSTYSNEGRGNESGLLAWLGTVDQEAQGIMAMLDAMKATLQALLRLIQDKIGALAEEVTRVTARIDIHEHSKAVADEALAVLGRIVAEARALAPASREFKVGLRRMNEQYTMESERRVHQTISNRQGLGLALAAPGQAAACLAGEPEFGDNVDLF